jgi:hypothetical protein
VLAAALGVCVDTYSVGPNALALSAHSPLCELTGGVCFHYPTLEQSALPQDLCRCALCTPEATVRQGALPRARARVQAAADTAGVERAAARALLPGAPSGARVRASGA